MLLGPLILFMLLQSALRYFIGAMEVIPAEQDTALCDLLYKAA